MAIMVVANAAGAIQRLADLRCYPVARANKVWALKKGAPVWCPFFMDCLRIRLLMWQLY